MLGTKPVHRMTPDGRRASAGELLTGRQKDVGQELGDDPLVSIPIDVPGPHVPGPREKLQPGDLTKRFSKADALVDGYGSVVVAVDEKYRHTDDVRVGRVVDQPPGDIESVKTLIRGRVAGRQKGRAVGQLRPPEEPHSTGDESVGCPWDDRWETQTDGPFSATPIGTSGFSGQTGQHLDPGEPGRPPNQQAEAGTRSDRDRISATIRSPGTPRPDRGRWQVCIRPATADMRP